jgi:hypothetical protein
VDTPEQFDNPYGIAWIALDSDWLKCAGHNPDTLVMGLRLKNGKTWFYEGVPISVYAGLLTADSAGQYYHSHIKGRYKAPEV